jgi:activating signal cointegrator 1
MKAISLWQPWAILWLLEGEKEYETRGWSTCYRGPLLVHASAKRDGEVRDELREPYTLERMAAYGLRPEDLAYGAIIGRVELINCFETEALPPPSMRECCFGNWEDGRYAWQRAPNPELFKRPIPYKGRQRLFNVPEGIL